MLTPLVEENFPAKFPSCTDSLLRVNKLFADQLSGKPSLFPSSSKPGFIRRLPVGGTLVKVGVGVFVAVGVVVGVAVFVAVPVAVGVPVFVGDGPTVGGKVAVKVAVAVGVSVLVGVLDGVGVLVGVPVFVGVGVGPRVRKVKASRLLVPNPQVLPSK